MTCTIDREMLSLYVNGDLTPAEEKAVTEHLGHCDECRQMTAQYREGAAALATVVAVTSPSLSLSKRPLHSRRRWVLPAAAAAAVLLFAVAVAPAVEALAVRIFVLKEDVMKIEEYTPEELEEILNRTPEERQALDREKAMKAPPGPEVEGLPSGALVVELSAPMETPPAPSIIYPTSYSSIEEAEQAAGFHILRMPAIPAGYALTDVLLSMPPEGPEYATVSTRYVKGSTYLYLMHVNNGEVTVLSRVGETREVNIDSKSAAIRETPIGSPNSGRISRVLYFTWNNSAMSLGSSGPRDSVLSDNELIALAQSIQ